MYKVLIAEDESASARYLKNVIEKKCEGFEVAAIVADGKSALRLIEKEHFDVLITDIYMPIMSGIELVTNVYKINPQMPKIIVSGYSEFDYAQKAIKAEVTDYLLKPINIESITSLMASVKLKLDNKRFDKKLQILRDMVNGRKTADLNLINQMFPKRFQMALVYKGGLYLNYFIDSESKPTLFETLEISEEDYTQHDVWIIPKKNRDYVIILSCTPDVLRKATESFVEEYSKDCYLTSVVYDKHINIHELNDARKNLRKAVNNIVITGKTQMVTYTEKLLDKPVLTQDYKKYSTIIKQYALNGKYSALKDLIYDYLKKWEDENRSQLWVYEMVASIFEELDDNDQNTIDIDKEMSLIAYLSLTAEHFNASVWDLFERFLSSDKNSALRQDIESFFESIIEFIEKNYASAISLQSVCDTYSISQTYLSRLFRKYKKMSFNNFLTELRIQNALEFMKNYPDMTLKSISDMVGYNDPAYFSKVFRSVMGKSPSHYQIKG